MSNLIYWLVSLFTGTIRTTSLLQQEIWYSNVWSAVSLLVLIVAFWCGTVSDRNSGCATRRCSRVILSVRQLPNILPYGFIDVFIELLRRSTTTDHKVPKNTGESELESFNIPKILQGYYYLVYYLWNAENVNNLYCWKSFDNLPDNRIVALSSFVVMLVIICIP